MKTSHIHIDSHLGPDELVEIMRKDIRAGLESTPKKLLPKYFYDARGSELFEEITEQPEYYQTRTERKLLIDIAPDLVQRHHFEELLELGSGSSTKTRVLLDPMHNDHHLRKYIPFDVSPSMVHRVGEELTAEYPELEVHGIIGDFTRHLREVPKGSRRLIVFLGGTIGNFEPQNAVRFLSDLASTLTDSDRILLGTDLVKDVRVLEAAYNDQAGVTAEFNRNILRVINNELDADFPVEGYQHHAFFNDEDNRIEMWLRSTSAHRVRVNELGLELDIREGEPIRTELSHKFTRTSAQSMVQRAGLRIEEWHTDAENLFALSLLALAS